MPQLSPIRILSIGGITGILMLASCSTETPLDQTIPGSRHSPMRGETQYLKGYEPVGMRSDTVVSPRNPILSGDDEAEANDVPASDSTMIAPAHGGRHEWPTAEAFPNRPGIVKSPYTQQPVDVEGMRSSSLATDPTAPGKYFRVP